MKPNDFLAFVQISSMWSLQDILKLMNTQRYLTAETQFDGKSLTVYYVLTVLRLLEILSRKSSAWHSTIILVDQCPPAIE